MSLCLTVLMLFAGPLREFEVTASKFKFEPAVFEVSEGDRVVLKVRSADVEHGLAIKKLRVKTSVPSGGEAVIVEFVAPAPGEYEITCAEYCGKGHSRMKGKLVVRARATAGAQK